MKCSNLNISYQPLYICTFKYKPSLSSQKCKKYANVWRGMWQILEAGTDDEADIS